MGIQGGLTEHFVYNVRILERMSVSAVIIEDNPRLKKTVFLVQKWFKRRRVLRILVKRLLLVKKRSFQMAL